MMNARYWRSLHQAICGFHGRRANVGHRQLRQRCQRLRRIGRLLQAAQFGHFGLNAREILGRKALGHGCQARGLAVVGLLHRHHFHLGHVAAFQKHAADKLLEIPLVKRAAQVSEVVLVAQVRGSQRIVVQPPAQR